MATTKRILFITPQFNRAGMQKAVLSLARRLDPNAFEPVICATQSGGSLEDEVRAANIELVHVGLDRVHTPGFAVRLTELLREHRIDHVQCHYDSANHWACLIAKRFGIPCDVVIHQAAEFHGLSYFLFRAASQLVTNWLADTTVCVSEATRTHVVESFGVSASRISVIYNGVDPSTFAPDARRRELMRKELPDLGQETRYVVTVGNLWEGVKGYETLLEAIPRITEACPGAVFLWAGRDIDGFRARLESRINELGVERHVYFLGLRDDIPDLLNACDLYVHPSHREALPFAVMEGCIAGNAVVASRVGGIPEMVLHRKTGLLVEPRDAKALANDIIWLLSDDVLRSTYASAARKYCVEKFSLETMIRRYEQVLSGGHALG